MFYTNISEKNHGANRITSRSLFSNRAAILTEERGEMMTENFFS